MYLREMLTLFLKDTFCKNNQGNSFNVSLVERGKVKVDTSAQNTLKWFCTIYYKICYLYPTQGFLSTHSNSTIHIEAMSSNVVSRRVQCKETSHTSNFFWFSKSLQWNPFRNLDLLKRKQQIMCQFSRTGGT